MHFPLCMFPIWIQRLYWGILHFTAFGIQKPRKVGPRFFQLGPIGRGCDRNKGYRSYCSSIPTCTTPACTVLCSIAWIDFVKLPSLKCNIWLSRPHLNPALSPFRCPYTVTLYLDLFNLEDYWAESICFAASSSACSQCGTIGAVGRCASSTLNSFFSIYRVIYILCQQRISNSDRWIPLFDIKFTLAVGRRIQRKMTVP